MFKVNKWNQINTIKILLFIACYIFYFEGTYSSNDAEISIEMSPIDVFANEPQQDPSSENRDEQNHNDLFDDDFRTDYAAGDDRHPTQSDRQRQKREQERARQLKLAKERRARELERIRLKEFFEGSYTSKTSDQYKALDEKLSNHHPTLLFNDKKNYYNAFDSEYLASYLKYLDIKIQEEKGNNYWKSQKSVAKESLTELQSRIKDQSNDESKEYRSFKNGTALQQEIYSASTEIAKDFISIQKRVQDNFANNRADPVFKNVEEYYSAVAYTSVSLNYAKRFANPLSGQYQDYGPENAEKISTTLLGIAHKTTSFALGFGRGIYSSLVSDLDSIKHIPQVFNAFAGVTWNAIKNPVKSVNSIINMIEAFDSARFAVRLEGFLESKLDDFIDAAPAKKGHLLGVFAKEVLMLALPAGIGIKAMRGILNTGKRAKVLRSVKRLAMLGEEMGHSSLINSVKVVNRTLQRAGVDTVEKVIDSARKLGLRLKDKLLILQILFDDSLETILDLLER